MPENVVHSHTDGDDSVHPYQSVWMSHIKRTSCKSANQACNNVITNHDSIKDGHGTKKRLLVGEPELGINVSDHAGRSQQLAESRAANANNGSLSIVISSKKMKNERLDNQLLQGSSLFMNNSLASMSRSSVGVTVGNGRGEAIAPSSSREFNSTSKALAKYPEKQGNSINFLDNSLVASAFFRDESKGSASKYLPLDFLSKGLPLPSSGKDHNYQPITSMSKNQKPPDVAGMKCDNMQNQSNFELFQSKSHSKAAKLNKLHNGCYSRSSQPLSIHGVETMRICTTIDSLEESSRGPPKICKTTHHFLITKKTDVNLSEEAQMLRESTVTAKLKGKHLSDLFDESTDFSIHNQKKPKLLQPFGSSAENEGRGNTKDIGTSAVCPSNESSAETDTMDLGTFQENDIAGLASPPSNKDLEIDQKVQSRDPSAFAVEFGDGNLNPELLDINKELPDFPIHEKPAHMKDVSTSRTRSLDLEHLFSHAQQLKNSKPAVSRDSSFVQDLSNRWVKRLKCSASGEKVNQFNKIIEYSGSEPTRGESYVKKQKRYDERKNREMLLLNPWIQRWCSNRAATSVKKLEPVAICEPECSKMTLNEYQRKQFPSIAAMALMGKAMNGFRPCEITKKGPYLVWNTEGL